MSTSAGIAATGNGNGLSTSLGTGSPLSHASSAKEALTIAPFPDSMAPSPNVVRKTQSFYLKSGGPSPTRKSINLPPHSPNPNGGGSSSLPQESNIQVAVRCRPLNTDEKSKDLTAAVLCNSEKNTITINHALVGGPKKTSRTWEFDKVYGMYSTQLQIFHESVAPILEEAISGFNCTVFAYGPTGTGKTYTMEGDLSDEGLWGMIPRAAQTIFDRLQTSTYDFTVKISLLEIYNEELRDLLATNSDRRLKLMEDLRRGVVCANLEEFVVRNMTEVMDYLRKGAVNRQVAATGSNLYSSRSHTIFTFHVIMECSDKQGDEFIKHGQINFVDLAGSECIGRSGAKDERAREAGSINQSLLTLGRVITALVDFHPHVPYRDSKLTRLLQESLGGKAKTLIIATVSPATISAEESTFTIDYAFRARSIKNQPQTISQTTSKTAIKHYIAEIEMLKAQLAASREKNGVYMDNNEYLATQAKILALENMLEESEVTIRVRDGEITALKKEAFSLEETVNKQDFEIQSLKTHAEVLSSKLAVTTDHLQATYLQLLAAEAVTDEQSATEKSLTSEAKKMQTIINTREDEVSRLLDKVDRLEKAEVARLEMTKTFLQELANGQADLKKSLTACLSSSETQSAALGGGVEKMLSQGRTTCDTLQSALGAALSGLLSEATQAKQDMLTVLEDARSETKSISESTHDRFVAAGAAWDERITALLSKLTEAGDHLQTQERTNNEVASKVKEEFDHLQEMITKLRLVQENGCKDLLTQLRNLRMTIEAQALRYERESARQLDESHEKVVAKAQHLQKAVEEMVRDLLASSEDLVNGTKTMAKEHCKTISDEMGKGADGLEALSRQTLDNQLLHADKMHIWGKASQNGLTDGLNRIAQSKDAAKVIISDTLPELLQSFQSDYQQELNSVEQLTSQKVTQVHEHLARAQSNSTKQADFIQEWTSSSAVEQEKLVNDLKNNFDDSGASLQTIIKSGKEETAGYISSESGMVQAEADLAQGHLDAVIASKSRPRGDSPVRLERSALSDLAATRDHVEIGKEILRAHLEGDLEWKAQIEELTLRLDQLLAQQVDNNTL